MKPPKLSLLAIFLLVLVTGITGFGQTPSPTPLSPQAQAKRDATRDRLRTLLNNLPKDMNLSFRQSDKNLYNFVGTLNTGLKNVQFLEIVVGISDNETIGFRIYPHYNGSYLNVDKARNSAALMRQMLRQSDTNFLYWGADSSGDIFAGYTITLESGFPEEAVRIVLWSVSPLDGFVGRMRPNIDGTNAAP